MALTHELSDMIQIINMRSNTRQQNGSDYLEDPVYPFIGKYLLSLALSLKTERDKGLFVSVLYAYGGSDYKPDIGGSTEDENPAGFYDLICRDAGIDKEVPKNITNTLWSKVIDAIRQQTKKCEENSDKSNLQKNIKIFTEDLKLSTFQKECITFFYTLLDDGVFNSIMESLFSKFGSYQTASQCLGIDVENLKSQIGHNGILFKTGLLLRPAERPVDGRYSLAILSPRVKNFLATDNIQSGDAINFIMGPNQTTSLKRTDYVGHLDPGEMDLAFDLVKKGARGINPPFIILVGDVGSGKSEFTKWIAENLGLYCVFAGSTNEGETLRRSDQIADIRLKMYIAALRKNVVLVIDDAEKLMANPFGAHEANYTDRAFLNELTLNPKVPLIFTCNSLPFDRSVRRRARLIVQFPETDRAFQTKVWTKISADKNVRLSTSDVEQLVDRFFPVQPALIETAVGNAVSADKLEGPQAVETIGVTLRSLMRYVNGTSRPRQDIPPAPFRYEPDILNIEIDGLPDKGDFLRGLETNKEASSFIVFGHPGNGQETVVEQIANRLGAKAIYLPTGQLQKSQDIEALFDRCYDEQKILIIDDTSPERVQSPLRHLVYIQEITKNIRRRDVSIIMATSSETAALYTDSFEHSLHLMPPGSVQRAAIARRFLNNIDLPEIVDATLSDYMTVASRFATAAKSLTADKEPAIDEDKIRAQIDARVRQRKNIERAQSSIGFAARHK